MKVSGAIYILVCGVLWSLPLFQILHVESAAVIAFVSFFVAGLSAIQLFKGGASVHVTIVKHLALLLVPLVMLTFSLFWQPNCAYGQGLLFFLLFPGVTVPFAVSLAFGLVRSGVKQPKFLLIGVGLIISIAGPIYDIGFHSQFYTYNHVFGGVMGPIYDEEITIRKGLVFFRVLSLLWAALFLFIGQIGGTENWILKGARACVIFGIGAIYFFSAPLQINSPAWYIQQELGGHLATEHFDIYYDPEATSSFELYQYEHDHEFRYAYFKEQLGVEVRERVQSFIYPDPFTKERLTGARFTNVAPVWLRTPQMHMYADVFDNVFAHELVHVFSRKFGLPIINASLSVGLVEGLAVALEPSEGRPTPHEQVLTASVVRNGGIELDVGTQVEGSLSPLGFWTGRGAVSYTTMGSFVRYLIDHYGIERIMAVYAFGNFKEVYGKTPRDLTQEWEAYLKRLPVVQRVTHDYVTRRFSVPSLFEQRCPHHIPRAVVKHRESMRAFSTSDTTGALRALKESFKEEPLYQPAIETWSLIQLSLNAPDSVVTRMNRLFSGDQSAYKTPLMWVLYGDAHALIGNKDHAVDAYMQAQSGLPLFAHDQLGFLEIRKALIDYPHLLSILLAPLMYEDKVEALRSFKEVEDLSLFLEAILHSNASEQEDARYALEAVDIRAIPGNRIDKKSLGRYFRIKKVEVFFQTGAIKEALKEAVLLEDEFIQIGALQEAAFYADFANKMRYISPAL